MDKSGRLLSNGDRAAANKLKQQPSPPPPLLLRHLPGSALGCSKPVANWLATNWSPAPPRVHFVHLASKQFPSRPLETATRSGLFTIALPGRRRRRRSILFDSLSLAINYLKLAELEGWKPTRAEDVSPVGQPGGQQKLRPPTTITMIPSDRLQVGQRIRMVIGMKVTRPLGGLVLGGHQRQLLITIDWPQHNTRRPPDQLALKLRSRRKVELSLARSAARWPIANRSLRSPSANR